MVSRKSTVFLAQLGSTLPDPLYNGKEQSLDTEMCGVIIDSKKKVLYFHLGLLLDDILFFLKIKRNFLSLKQKFKKKKKSFGRSQIHHAVVSKLVLLLRKIYLAAEAHALQSLNLINSF